MTRWEVGLSVLDPADRKPQVPSEIFIQCVDSVETTIQVHPLKRRVLPLLLRRASEIRTPAMSGLYEESFVSWFGRTRALSTWTWVGGFRTWAARAVWSGVLTAKQLGARRLAIGCL